MLMQVEKLNLTEKLKYYPVYDEWHVTMFFLKFLASF